MRQLLCAFATLALLTLAALLIAWDRFSAYLNTAPQTGAPELIVVIPEGAGPRAVVDLFARSELVARPDWLEFYVDYLADQIEIRPGEYALSAAMSPVDLLHKIESGKVVTYPVEIPAGADVPAIVQLLAAKKLGDETELLHAARDRRTAASLGVPSDELEGFLFPDHYELPRNLSPAALLGMLVARYKKVVTSEVLGGKRDGARRAQGGDVEEREVVTLASLIEKSGVLPGERKLYAAMLRNRLKAGLPLSSPASVAYGLKRLGMLDVDSSGSKRHPWDTERSAGLPPTPICSPSLAAILAAVEPENSAVLGMISRRDGSHQFCDEENCERPSKVGKKKKHKKHKRHRS